MSRPKGEVAKKKMGFYVDEELSKDFHRFVAERYGTVEGGLLSREAEAALRSWMLTHRNAQKQLIAPNPLANVNMVREQVKQYLREQLGYDVVHEVPLKHLREAIGAVRGTDSRTIKKWVDIFVRYHLVKWMSAQVVEFL
jgi:hypothetical protein